MSLLEGGFIFHFIEKIRGFHGLKFLSCCLEASLVVQSLSCVRLFPTPWTVACQASLSFTISWSSTESVMPSNHLILCFPLLLLHFYSVVSSTSTKTFLYFEALQHVSYHGLPSEYLQCFIFQDFVNPISFFSSPALCLFSPS